MKNYEDLYQVSNFGNVKRVEGFVTRKDGRTRKVKETILKPTTNNKGYLCVQLCIVQR
ncbi:NUMOD4 domain-containing protein [Microcystis aeruginosa]|uniref:NUMOD4 domain-containing protein n=1 Tax=Microcystis aeruginosa TaxID=1126 RepID=UPI003B5885A0